MAENVLKSTENGFHATLTREKKKTRWITFRHKYSKDYLIQLVRVFKHINIASIIIDNGIK